MGGSNGRSVCLVLLETGGNQAFIFETNKLRENVGASELTFRAGTKYVLCAIAKATGQPCPAAPDQRRTIEQGAAVEPVILASGKALLLVESPELGRAIVREATRRAVKEAPGLDLRGVVGQPFAFGGREMGAAVQAVHADLAQLRQSLRGPETRFLRLPIVAACQTSGGPAHCCDTDPEGREVLRSQVVAAKRRAADAGFERLLQGLARLVVPRLEDIEGLFEGQGDGAGHRPLEWVGVVHADGNGLGQLLQSFGGDLADRDYINQLRAFSEGLDACTLAAARTALEGLETVQGSAQPIYPVVPLVLGGDDLTVLCDGRQAVRFAQRFLAAYETTTATCQAVTALAPDGLTSCAGVAITKRNAPFHLAYQVAEQLLRSAKQVKDRAPGHSALDFQLLFDSTEAELERRRQAWTEREARLTARPYVVGEPTAPWARPRRWSRLEARVEAMLAEDAQGRRQLPGSQLHELREGLFVGEEEANARYNLIRHRYPTIERVAADGGKALFESDGEGTVTGFLDALEMVEFWRAQTPVLVGEAS